MFFTATLSGCASPIDMLTTPHPQISSPESKAAFVVARKEGFKTLRRILKKQVEHEFANDMYTYEVYESKMADIHGIGNYFPTTQDSATDFDAKSAKGEVLKREYKDGEEALDLIEWGPFRINDEGSVRCTFDSLRDLFRGKSSTTARFIDDEPKKKEDSNRMKDKWDFHGRLNLHISPWGAVYKQDMEEFGYNVGTTFSIDRIYGSKGQTIYSLEYEVKYCNDRDIINFFSVSIPLR